LIVAVAFVANHRRKQEGIVPQAKLPSNAHERRLFH
jgi:hypothetical protein